MERGLYMISTVLAS